MPSWGRGMGRGKGREERRGRAVAIYWGDH